MDNNLLEQLAELVIACHRKNVKPIVCGGLGVYLSFCNKDDEINQMLRATWDIDLMLSKKDLLEEAKRNAIAEIITNELKYIAQPNKQIHGFKKNGNQELDILVPPVKGLPKTNHRLKIVKSILHGYITEEAEFIDEELRVVRLSDISADIFDNKEVELYVPSPTNLIIMKLFAYNDRCQGKRQSPDRAMAHAWDVYIAIMLTDITDFKEGQAFLKRHADSGIITKAKSIIESSFSQYEKGGWQIVMSSPNFYPTMNIAEREEKLKQATARIVRWFNVSS